MLTVNNYFGVLQAVIHDLGIGVLPDYVTQDFDGVQRVLHDVESVEVPVYLAYPEELRHSKKIETFTDGLLEYPQYTKPNDFKGLKIPDILLSGNHEAIKKWQENQSLNLTKLRRPDLIAKKKDKI